MKKLIACLASLRAFGCVGSAVATSPGKTSVLHCGCADDTAGNPVIAYVYANASTKAKGHTKYFAGSIDTRFIGVDIHIVFQRIW